MSELESSEGRPNLTPILDMVFQLITFFMLVINFKTASMDVNLRLPVIGSARPVDTKGVSSFLVLNVDKNGDLRVYGQSQAIRQYIAREAEVEYLAMRRRDPKFQRGDELPTMVVVRADRATPFNLVNRVLTECQRNGFRRFALKAATKEEGG